MGEENKEDNLTALNAALASAKELAEQDQLSPSKVKETCEHLDTVYSDLRPLKPMIPSLASMAMYGRTPTASRFRRMAARCRSCPCRMERKNGGGSAKIRRLEATATALAPILPDDLYNWTFEGYVMRSVPSREALDTDPYFTALYGDLTEEEKDYVYLCINKTNAIIERPKMIYNEETKKYIIWFHADGPTEESDSSYAAAAAGMAISDTPNGPFTFIRRSRLHQRQMKSILEDNGVLDWYEEPQNRGFARDMNLFIDDDGTAYIIYSSEENRTMFISRLNDEYTDLRCSAGASRPRQKWRGLCPSIPRRPA